MKKEITYYLEDTSRLKEISQTEMDAWIAEMPFHQPLQMLAGIKSEMDGHATDNGSNVYAAYFAEDFEPIVEKGGKKREKNGKKSEEVTQTIVAKPIEAEENLETPVMEESVSPIVETDKIVEETQEEITNMEVVEDESVDDTVKGEVSSELADEILEDEIISEVLEEKISIVAPSGTINEEEEDFEDHSKGEVYSELADEILEEEIDVMEGVNAQESVVEEEEDNSLAEIESMLNEPLEIEAQESASMVDYKDHVEFQFDCMNPMDNICIALDNEL